VALDIFKERGTPLERQEFDWKDLVRIPYSKLNDEAFTRVRVILMNGLEAQCLRFLHAFSLMNRDVRLELARVRRTHQHQQTLVNWLTPPDQSVLETTLGFEQVAIEVTAHVARHEPDPYLAQVHRFGMLEDFDHLYRYSALYDRVEGKDPNAILQSYTDILPGRPTSLEHRHPVDDVRRPYDRRKAHPLTKLHALTIYGGEFQTHDFYMTVGPTYPDPVGRQLYAEIASIEEQHVTQYGSIIDPDETWLEKWLLHEATQVYNYLGCVAYETNPRIKSVWERLLDYELGLLHFVKELFERHENRDAASVLPAQLPEPIRYEAHREYIRQVLREERELQAHGADFMPLSEVPESSPTRAYQARINSQGSPSDTVAAGWRWSPGTELTTPAAAARASKEGRLQ
jgi:hypothetical protein